MPLNGWNACYSCIDVCISLCMVSNLNLWNCSRHPRIWSQRNSRLTQGVHWNFLVYSHQHCLFPQNTKNSCYCHFSCYFVRRVLPFSLGSFIRFPCSACAKVVWSWPCLGIQLSIVKHGKVEGRMIQMIWPIFLQTW